MVQSGVESPVDTTIEMELDLLEEKVQEAATLIERLRNEKRALEEECLRLRSERGETLNRLSRILEKVDSLASQNTWIASSGRSSRSRICDGKRFW